MKMEDKQIIELYWERLEEAIRKTEEKYGSICTYIANNILCDENAAEVCVKQCYERLWETIPPRRPQNLKAYLCKITRSHALNMRYPEIAEQETDLFAVELIIQEFLKGLEPETRKLFVAHYWYFAAASEIAIQYKMNENKVNSLLVSLHQKLENELEQKQVLLQTEEVLLYAMTEVEDRYLEEATLQMEVSPKIVHEEIRKEPKILLLQIWKKFQI